MKTPYEFSTNLKHGIITRQMLGFALFGANKRAKNAGKKISEYNHKYTLYRGTIDCSKCYYTMRARYYDFKDDILAILKPVAIHRIKSDDVWKDDKYYLYFDFGCGKAHKPIFFSNISSLELNIFDIEQLSPKSVSNSELASPQFIRKIAELINSGNYSVSNDLATYIK